MIDFINSSLPIAGLLSGNPYVAKMQLIVGIGIFATFSEMFLSAIGAGKLGKFIYFVGMLSAIGITIDMATNIYHKLV